MVTDSEAPPLQLSGRFSPAEKIALSLEVLRAYVRVRWLLVRRGLPETVRILRGGLAVHRVGGPEWQRRASAARYGRIVVRILRLLPTDGRCLMRSLVLASVLARRGIHGRVVIGVRPDPSFAAHAWIEVDGQPVLATDQEEFHRLTEL
ncbi:MAG: lasso peptide biosynthesis B2 protein [Gaiellaceae bacterium]